MHVYVYTDGASRNNPGKSASGYEIFDSGHKLVAKESVYNGIRTNNQAEYIALITALDKLGRELGFDNEVELYSDSQLMIRQLKGEYKVKEEDLKVLHVQAKDLLKRFNSVKLNNVPRENRHISDVDASLNELLDSIG